MGCCVSAHKTKTPLKTSNTLENNNNNNTHQFQCVSKSPPRAEEEAVKEVLSETPKPRSRPRSRPESPKKRQVEVVDEHADVVVEAVKPATMMQFVTPNKAFLEQQKTGPGAGGPYPDPITPEEISEASEMCSFSETISTSTLKEEDDLQHYHQHHHQFYGGSNRDTAASGEARQRVFRSQGYNGNFVQHHHYQPPQQQQQQQQQYKSQGRSPARRRPESDSSPARKRPPGTAVPRRETDNSGRRSQSPAMRGGVGRSPSARKTGPSPGRVRMVHGPESGKKVQEEEEAAGIGGRRESEEWQGPKESLENPLVSLECFIFL